MYYRGGYELPRDPGPGPDLVEVNLSSVAESAMMSVYPTVPIDVAVRCVLAASASPATQPNPYTAPRAEQPVPSIEPGESHGLPPWLATVISMLLPVVVLVLAFLVLRRIPASRGGGGFEEWTGGA
jgi:hypothetical protein